MIGNLMIVSYMETYRYLVFVDFQASFLLFAFCAVLGLLSSWPCWCCSGLSY